MTDIILTITPKQLEWIGLENEINRLSELRKFTEDKKSSEELSEEIFKLKHQQEILK